MLNSNTRIGKKEGKTYFYFCNIRYRRTTVVARKRINHIFQKLKSYFKVHMILNTSVNNKYAIKQVHETGYTICYCCCWHLYLRNLKVKVCNDFIFQVFPWNKFYKSAKSITNEVY